MSSAILSRMAASHAKPAVSFLATAVVVTALTTTAPQDQAAPASVFNKPLALPTVAGESESAEILLPSYAQCRRMSYT
jgi:hypothetical protein